MAESWGDAFYPITSFPVRSILFDDIELYGTQRWVDLCEYFDLDGELIRYNRLLEGNPTGDGVCGKEESRTATIDKDDGED